MQACPKELAGHLANLSGSARRRSDIVLVAGRTGKAGRRGRGDLFRRTATFFRLNDITSATEQASRFGTISTGWRWIARTGIRSGMPGAGSPPPWWAMAQAESASAVEAWVAPRKSEVERIRLAIHEIANSGLTLSKLSVAASLLGDLVKN